MDENQERHNGNRDLRVLGRESQSGGQEMSFNEEKLIVWMDKTDKRLAHLEGNQVAIINGDFWGPTPNRKEPLIMDKKKHKIIRACASLDSVKDVKVVKRSSDDTTTLIFDKTTLTLKGREEYASLQQCGTYAIDELCGEEDE